MADKRPKQKAKTLILKRNQMKDQLNRFAEHLRAFNQVESSIIELEKRLEKIENIWDTFIECQSEIEIIESDNNSQLDEREAFEELYYKVVSEGQELIERTRRIRQGNETPVNSNASNNSICTNVQLPVIQLPIFSGVYNEFMQFHDTFNSLINNNSNLTNIQKFYYLKSSLKGEAAEIIHSLEITDGNYEIAWNLIRERFDNKRIIINSHLKAIFDLPKLNKESSSELRQFLNSFLKNIRALKNLGESTDQWSTMLIYLLSSKLDYNTKRYWESSISSNRIPTINEFIAFLNSRCQLLETLSSSYGTPTSNTGPNKAGQYHKQNNQNKKFTNVRSVNNVATTSSKLKCQFCNESHLIYYCPKFLELSTRDRLTEIRKRKLCTKCLRVGHANKDCFNIGCKICNKGHNTLLHLNNHREENDIPSTSAANNDTNADLNLVSEAVTVNAHVSEPNKTVILSTAIILINDINNKPIKCRCLLDSGSQSNFITANLAKQLKIPYSEINLPISGINQVTSTIRNRINARIQSMSSKFNCNLSFLILDNITDNIPTRSFEKTCLKVPNGIQLADPNFNQSQKIDLLLGATIFYDLLCVGQIKCGNNMPTFQNTELGWIISGPIMCNNKINKLISAFSLNADLNLNDDNQKIQNQLERFWNIESEYIETEKISKYSKEEQYCENHFLKYYERDIDGRFTVAFPLKDDPHVIGNTKVLAENRFFNLEKKLHKNKEFLELYTKFMREYEALGHMSKLDDSEVEDNIVAYYLPHHGVLKESSMTTKLRVVFDASAKGSKGFSLNDISCVGPTIQDDLFSILLRFRKYKYVLKADIAKMYRQINIQKSDRNLQRIVWRESPNEKLKYFQLNTVTYGCAPSSFLAIRSLHQAAKDSINEFPVASKIILTDFYVDDLITGSDSLQDLVIAKCQISDILKGAGFILTQFMSNENELLSEHASQQPQFYMSNDVIMKTLGISWEPNQDTFRYPTRNKNFDCKLTKRTILSIIAQIFDPLGLLGPIVVMAKFILQKIWKLKLNWDDIIPQNLYFEFMQFIDGLQWLNNIVIPRHAFLSEYINIQLHVFSDASIKAYGACIYMITSDSNERVYSCLLCAKCRVAPVKVISLPRLELCGALVAAKLARKVINAIKIENLKSYFWTDSTIVLGWLANEPCKWKTFVSNRVTEIQELTKNDSWGHVKSEDNPADLISRGVSTSNLIDNKLWWSGPDWIIKKVELWPKQAILNLTSLPEEKKTKLYTCFNKISKFDIFDKYSEVNKLINVIAYCLRFVNNTRLSKKDRIYGALTLSERNSSLNVLIMRVQRETFQTEIHEIKEKGFVSKKSKILSLNPFLCKDGLLRVGGRLRNSDFSFDKKFPILLPNHHVFTNLIIHNEHIRTLHGGVQTVLASIREKYWPINVKNAIKGIIRKCIKCFRVNPIKMQPIMGDLPKARVLISRPFLTSGVDFTGPILIKDGTLRNRKLVKSYICLFICFSTKAIHLELTGDLSTNSFLNTLKRFVSRRGIVKTIYSDNGLNFVGANQYIKRVQEFINKIPLDKEIRNYFLENKIDWSFIPPRAPHFGGLWESAIKLTKYHLNRILGNTHLNYENLNTVLCQIEAILNSRPICPISNDPNDFEALTPGHFLIGNRMMSLPEEDVQNFACNQLSRFQRLMQIKQNFWTRWKKEYLHSLQQRQKWKCGKDSEMNIGDLVILNEAETPPLFWKLGRIEEIYCGKDNIPRVALVKTSEGKYKRAFNKICLLPINNQE